MGAAALTIVFVGNSTTGAIPPGGTTTPGEQACALLGARLGMTVDAQVAPWHGLTPGIGGAGAQTTDDLPGDPRGTGNYAATLALAAGTPHIYHVMLGTNDARYTSNSAALFGSNLATLVSALVASTTPHSTVIVPYDQAFDASAGGYNTSGNLALLQSYQAQIASLVDGTDVFLGDTTMYDTILANLGWLYDGTHLDNTHGVPAQAAAWAAAIAPIIARSVQWSPPPAIGLPWG